MLRSFSILFLSLACLHGRSQDLGSVRQGQLIRVGDASFRVKGICNPELQGKEFSQRFRYEKWDNPKIIQLARQYDLKKVISGGKSEFEQMVILNSWVFHQFRKFGQPTKNTRNALEILSMIPEGATFFCSQFASTLLSAAYSVGWTARAVGLHNLRGNPGSPEHSTVELWSNEYRKWILFDPTFEIYLEKDGVPLNAKEIRDEWFRNDGADLEYVRGVEGRRYTLSDLPVDYPGTGFSINAYYPDWYSFLLYFGNADYMDHGEDYGKNCFMIVDDRNKAVEWHTREIPKDLRDAYWTLGEAKMKITPKGSNALAVSLETNTPGLDTYLVRRNGGKWRETGADFLWELKKDVNELDVTTRNQAGILGPVNSISLERVSSYE